MRSLIKKGLHLNRMHRNMDMLNFVERRSKMKKLHILDKISLALIILNVISSISFFAPAGTVWSALLLGFIFYSFFLMWISIPVGIVLNLISVAKKSKSIKSIWINILMLIIFVLNIPLYKYLFDCAMSV